MENKAICTQEWTALIPREYASRREESNHGVHCFSQRVFYFVCDVCVCQRGDRSVEHNGVLQCGRPHPFPPIAPLWPLKTALTRFKKRKASRIREWRHRNEIPDVSKNKTRVRKTKIDTNECKKWFDRCSALVVRNGHN